jgi:hypothetical protein
MPPSSEALIYSLGAAKSITNAQRNLLYGKELVPVSGNGAGVGNKIGESPVDFWGLGSLIFGLRRRIIGP